MHSQSEWGFLDLGALTSLYPKGKVLYQYASLDLYLYQILQVRTQTHDQVPQRAGPSGRARFAHDLHFTHF